MVTNSVDNLQKVCHNKFLGVSVSKFGDMYKAYIRDGEAAEVLEWDFGFLVLKYEANLLYIETIYVAPEFREQGKGREMLIEVENRAKILGKQGVLGSCSPNRRGATTSMKSMLACGFKLHSCEKDMIYLIKNLVQKEQKNG